MALTVTLLTSGALGNEATEVPGFTTASISPGTDCYLVFLMSAGGAAIPMHDTGHTVVSSGSGPTWTKQSYANAPSDFQHGGVVWTAPIGGSSPGSFTVTVDWPGTSGGRYSYSIHRVTGTLHATQPWTAATTANNTADGAVTVTLPLAPDTNDVTIALTATDSSSSGLGATFGTGTWTQTATGAGSGLQVCWNTGYRTGSTSASVPWSDVQTGGSEGTTSGQAVVVVREASSVTYPSFVAAGTLATFASGTTITTTIPGGATTNDIMILGLMANGSTTFSQPSGWTLLGTSTESSANMSTEWYWKRHTGSESSPASTTSATMSGTIGGYGRIWLFRNCITTGDPFEDVTMAGDVNTTTPASATIDTTGAARLAVSFVMIDDDVLWLSGNPPAGWDNIGTQATSTTGGDSSFAALSKPVATASTVTGVTLGTIASEYWRTLTLAFIPVPPPSADINTTGRIDIGTVKESAGVTHEGNATGRLHTATWLGTPPGGDKTTSGRLDIGTVKEAAAVTHSTPIAARTDIGVHGRAPSSQEVSLTGRLHVAAHLRSTEAPAQLWPTTRSGRRILDQNGNPWMIRGSAVWSLGTVSQADQFQVLDALAEHGHNCVMVTVTETYYSDNPDKTENFYGESPFTGNYFGSSLNSAFWDRWIETVEYGAALGISFMCVIAYAGLGGDGSKGFMNARTTTECQQYGNDLATLHLSHPNIAYMIGGDLNFTSVSSEGVRYNAMANGLRAADPSCLIFCHTGSDMSAFEQFGTGYTLSPFDANHVYTYGGEGVTDAVTAWSEATLPLYFVEGAYWHGEVEPDALFRSQLWMGCSWGLGCFDGHVELWSMGSDPAGIDWELNLTSPEMDFTKICYEFYSDPATDWQQTTPDFGTTFITTGIDTGRERVALCRGTSFVIMYVPDSRTINLNLTHLSGTNVVARWFDPTDATYTAIATWSTATSSQSVTHPGDLSNSNGESDWVLVLESDPVEINTTGLLVVAPTARSTVSRTATGTGRLDVAASPTSTVSRAATGTGRLDFSVFSVMAAVAGDLTTTGLLPLGLQVRSTIGHDIPTVGRVDAGSHPAGVGTHSVSVAVRVDVPVYGYGSVTRDMETTASLPVGATLRAPTSAAGEVSTTGLLVLTSGVRAPVSRQATPEAVLPVVIDVRVAVSRTTTTVAVLAVGTGTTGDVGRVVTVIGYLTAGVLARFAGTPVDFAFLSPHVRGHLRQPVTSRRPRPIIEGGDPP